MKKSSKILGRYLKAPLSWDTALSVLLAIVFYLLRSYLCVDTKDVTSVQYSLAGTAISLAGFILTALTIIVTIRANISYKGIEASVNGLELILNSSAYKQIVEIFKGAIIELVSTAVLLYITMLFSKSDAVEPYILSFSAGALLAIAATIFRCMYVLFNLVELEIKARENAPEPMPKPKKWRVNLESHDNGNNLPSGEFTIQILEQEVKEEFRLFD